MVSTLINLLGFKSLVTTRSVLLDQETRYTSLERRKIALSMLIVSPALWISCMAREQQALPHTTETLIRSH